MRYLEPGERSLVMEKPWHLATFGPPSHYRTYPAPNIYIMYKNILSIAPVF
ncbi:hypothetical protein [Microcoleus sp. bin38.metabat.b11b12b14.051]|uniref:hypothetical protein n=1 Tax=Microcoleus sp. bin38.metabat.b11b12b14.051 TaxID=2742709 RepID=UPI0025EA7776|nr:hypothetical protein [Microcoleus sp. bin38.metabat.b11b12b14.051]